MPDLRAIPIPLRQRLRRIRYRFLPVLVFAGALSATIWLWGHQAQVTHVSGEAEVVRLELTAPADGTLMPVRRRGLSAVAGQDANSPFVGQWQLFDEVPKGRPLIQMDDGPALKELAIVQSEILALNKQLLATEAQARQELSSLALDQADRKYQWLSEADRLAVEVESLRLDILDRKRRILALQAQLRHEKALLEVLEESRESGAATEFEVIDKQLLVTALAEEIKGRQSALAKAEEQLSQAQARQEAHNTETGNFPKLELAATETLLAPIRASITVQQSRLAQINRQIQSLEVRAPFDGIIREIFRWPYQTVRMGEPIMILVAKQSTHVLTYVREHHRVELRRGMRVRLRVRAAGMQPVEGYVEQIGPQVVAVPLQHLRDPQIPEWGLPVRIALPPDCGIRPGELVDITFL